MKVIRRIINKLKFICKTLLRNRDYTNLKKELNSNSKRIFLFGAPFHSNMGDQAQTLCSLLWFKKNYPEYKSYAFDTRYITSSDYKLLKLIKKYIEPEDKIFLHSGYHLTDLYMLEESMNRKVIELFDNNPITILPQTILFKNENEKNKTIEIYNKHKNLTVLCRDDLSYETAKQMFTNCKLLKYPDIVTTLIGTKEFNNTRKGILLCMRNDKEAFYSKENIDKLRGKLEKIDKTDITDTTIDLKAEYISNNREKVINNILNSYSNYKVIITDRYHGTIFSLISNTPVIVLSSTDHKLSSGVKWFPESFKEYVRYMQNIADVPDYVEKIFKRDYQYKLSNYFNEQYYDKLKAILEKEVN
jgi:exopolysaccharide biosynthesis predicted pyruvyltransferase EpsI